MKITTVMLYYTFRKLY